VTDAGNDGILASAPNSLTCGLSNDSSTRCATEPGRTETHTETRQDHEIRPMVLRRQRRGLRADQGGSKAV
jgi:hypothetical protein